MLGSINPNHMLIAAVIAIAIYCYHVNRELKSAKTNLGHVNNFIDNLVATSKKRVAVKQQAEAAQTQQAEEKTE